jgi:glutathione synthase/RimK-type ligase-like ATP-grasp enzyme
MLVLLWGFETDPPLLAVREQLRTMGTPSVLVDQRFVLDTDVNLQVGKEVEATIQIGGCEIDLANVTAAYIRPHDSHRLPEISGAGPQSLLWRHAIEVDDILSSWSEITSAFVVNRLSAMASNNSKPYQLQQIQRLGFSVPETLITTDPKAAQAFWERHGNVIYKSISSIRSRVARLGPEQAQRLEDIASCPTQFQQCINGTDYRVHVVGDEVFASEVLCEADDYRYPGQHAVEIRACTVPRDVEDRCRRLTTAMELVVAGIDLRRTPSGEWFCFEVNPSPGFTYYQEATGQPIARSIAILLADSCTKETSVTWIAVGQRDGSQPWNDVGPRS